MLIFKPTGHGRSLCDNPTIFVWVSQQGFFPEACTVLLPQATHIFRILYTYALHCLIHISVFSNQQLATVCLVQNSAVT